MHAYSAAFCSMVILMVTVTAPVLAEPEKAQPRGYKTENIERNGVAADLASIVYPPSRKKHFEYKGLSDSAAVEQELRRRLGTRFEMVLARYHYRGFQALAVRDVRDDSLFVVYAGSNDILDGLADVELFIETRDQEKIPKAAWTYISSPMLDVQIDASLIFYKEAKQLYPSSKVVVVGHSLGGALAQIVGAIHKETVVTFASPGLPTSLLFRRRIEINQTFDMIDYTSSKDVVGVFGQDIGTSIKVPQFFKGIRSHPLSEHGIDEYGRAVDTAESGTLLPQVDRPDLAPPPPARSITDEREENQRTGADFHSVDRLILGAEKPTDEDGGTKPQQANHPANSTSKVETDQPPAKGKTETSKPEASADSDKLQMIDAKTGKVLLNQGPMEEEEVKAEKNARPGTDDERGGTVPPVSVDPTRSYTQDQWEEMQLEKYSKLVEARLREVINDIKPDTDPRHPDSIEDTREKADNVLAELGIKPDTDPWPDEFRDDGLSPSYIEIYIDPATDPKHDGVEDEVNPPRIEPPVVNPPIDASGSRQADINGVTSKSAGPVDLNASGGNPPAVAWVPRPSQSFEAYSDPFDDTIPAASDCEFSNVREKDSQISATIGVINPDYSSFSPIPDLMIDDPKKIFDEDGHVQTRVLIEHDVPGLMSNVERYRFDDVGFLLIGGGYGSDSVAEWAAVEQPDRQIYIVNGDDVEKLSQIKNVVSMELDTDWLGTKVANRIEKLVGKAEVYIVAFSSPAEIEAEKSSFARKLSGILDGMQGFAVDAKFATRVADFASNFSGSSSSPNKLIVSGRGLEPDLRKLIESQPNMREAYVLLIGFDEVALYDRGLPLEPMIKIPTPRDQVFQWAAKTAVEVARGASITFRGQHGRCKISRRIPG